MLEIRGAYKTFNPGTPNEVLALQGIDLAVEEGEFVVIIGTNGSGKSTLLNAIAGTFLPDSGRLAVDGRVVTRWAEHRRASLIGRVFQNPFSGTAPRMSIAENLALAAQRVRVLSMGLENRLDNPIGTLSGGQHRPLRC